MYRSQVDTLDAWVNTSHTCINTHRLGSDKYYLRSQRPSLTIVLAVDDVERPVWSTCILQHLGEQHGAGRHSLRGLQQIRVAAHHAHGEHPQRDHGREVEGCDSGTHPEGKAVGVCVHILGDGGQGFTKHQGGDAAGMLHNLCKRKDWSVCLQPASSVVLVSLT